jgi:transcriptional regulator with XRE-family HTH domain
MKASLKDNIDLVVGTRAQARREALGLTPKAVAAAIECDINLYHQIEAGSARPSATKLLALATTLNVKLQYFFDGLAPSVVDVY